MMLYVLRTRNTCNTGAELLLACMFYILYTYVHSDMEMCLGRILLEGYIFISSKAHVKLLVIAFLVSYNAFLTDPIIEFSLTRHNLLPIVQGAIPYDLLAIILLSILYMYVLFL